MMSKISEESLKYIIARLVDKSELLYLVAFIAIPNTKM